MRWKQFAKVAANITAHGWDRIDTQDDLNEFLTYLYETRVSLDDIAEMFGVSRSAVGQHVSTLGIRRSVSEGQRKGWRYFSAVRTRLRNQGIYINTPHELDLWCHRQSTSGLTAQHLGLLCGVTDTTIKVHLKRIQTVFRHSRTHQSAVHRMPPTDPPAGTSLRLTPTLSATLLGWRYDGKTNGWLATLFVQDTIMVCSAGLLDALRL